MRSPALLCLLLGALAALGFAPLQWWPLTLIGLAGWLHLVHAAPTARAAAWRGWLFGVGLFSVANNWIQHAFDFQQTMPPALGYLAPLALSLYLALFPAAAAVIAWRARGARPDAAYALAAGAAWIATEWLRGWLFTGYPWDPIAVIWIDAPAVPRLAAWIGTYALSGLTVAAAAGLLLLVEWRRRGLSRVMLVGGGLALVALLATLDILAPRAPSIAPGAPRLLVVQPNIGQGERGEEDGPRVLAALTRLTGGLRPYPRLILWPEGVVRPLLEDGYPDWAYAGIDPARVRARLARLLAPGDTLLAGGIALSFGADGDITGAGNAVFAIRPDAQLHGRYDKAHLVPYGEYLPLRPLLEPLGLSRLVPGDIDFDPGPGPRNLLVPGIGAVGVQVCYEIVFSGEVVDRAHRPRLLFNPSNDAWFGRWGPPQHLAQARLRAIEEGLPIVRSTPTGISAVIAADGALLASIPLGRAGTIDLPLPQPLPPTPFSRLGNLLALATALLLAAASVALRRRHR